MAYRARPYGVLAYSWGPYSTWRFPELAGVLPGASSVAADVERRRSYNLELGPMHAVSRLPQPVLNYDAIVRVQGALGARGGVIGNARLFWETEIPCNAPWAPAAPCDTVWTPAAACDVAWVTQGPPPLLCPELVDG